jgi:hypothetical protein
MGSVLESGIGVQEHIFYKRNASLSLNNMLPVIMNHLKFQNIMFSTGHLLASGAAFKACQILLLYYSCNAEKPAQNTSWIVHVWI